MPANTSGTPIDPTEWNRNDGFSPNSPLLVFVPGLDVAASGLPSWTDPSTARSPQSPVVLVDAATGELLPLWAELDAGAAEGDQLLVIRPARPLDEGRRYVVGLSGLVATDGTAIEPAPVFRAFRDRLDGPDWIEARRQVMEDDFEVLRLSGVDRSTLYLSWDFTVASQRNLAERALSIRDDALARFTEAGPPVTITSSAPGGDGLIAARIDGTVEVPNFLEGDGGPGSSFWYGGTGRTSADDLPIENGTIRAPFTCIVPSSDSGQPLHLVQYGHGLLGSADEVASAPMRDFAAEHDAVLCATDWIGMSSSDLLFAAAALGDVSLFPAVADRLQQGFVDAMVLGRAMTDEAGELVAALGDVDTSQLDFIGNSQGSILGLALTALSPDIERAVLGVPGINFSLLLPRSADFDAFLDVMRAAYPDDSDRMLVIALMQMLWDRGEGGGYANHVTSSPLPGSPPKDVLLQVALGDHQVTPLAALVEARAIDAAYDTPFAAPGRLRADTVVAGLDAIDAYPYPGSAIVLFDSGADEIPIEAVPPRTGHDPHQDPRADPEAREQAAVFLFDDQLIDVCGAQACTADPVAG
ncbi:MAG: hypothetical protein R2705_04650 [Ilumatobacteraceae bacterium]